MTVWSNLTSNANRTYLKPLTFTNYIYSMLGNVKKNPYLSNIHMYTYMYIYMYIYTYILYLYVYVYLYVYLYVYVYVYLYLYVYVYVYIYIYIDPDPWKVFNESDLWWFGNHPEIVYPIWPAWTALNTIYINIICLENYSRIGLKKTKYMA